MPANKPSSTPDTPTPWVDPDDAPELDDEFFKRGTWHIGEQQVSPEVGAAALAAAVRRGRPRVTTPRPTLNMRVDADVLAAFKATGKGWQTRVNAVLRAAVQKGLGD